MMELWLVDLEAAAPALEALEGDLPRLAADDRARALRASDPRERRHRLAAYMALRILLERIAGPVARRQGFVRGPRGKPHLATGEAAFSLSHTDGLALIGVAPAGAIGVDLERERALRMSARRRNAILAAGTGLATAPLNQGAGDDVVLLRAWCRLEAFAKAQGHGLAHVLAELGVRGGGSRQPSSAGIEAAARRLATRDGLEIRDLKLPPGLFAAVATAAPVAAPRPRHFPADAAAIHRLAGARPRSPR